MFQGLRENGTIYILDKTNIVPKLSVGIIEKKSDVYSRYGTPTMPMMSQPMDGVIDFTLRIGNDTAELQKIPANQSVCSPEGQPNIVVSDNREAILAEVANIKRQRQEVVDAYEPRQPTTTSQAVSSIADYATLTIVSAGQYSLLPSPPPLPSFSTL